MEEHEKRGMDKQTNLSRLYPEVFRRRKSFIESKNKYFVM